jgi:hypothetical protein
MFPIYPGFPPFRPPSQGSSFYSVTIMIMNNLRSSSSNQEVNVRKMVDQVATAPEIIDKMNEPDTTSTSPVPPSKTPSPATIPTTILRKVRFDEREVTPQLIPTWQEYGEITDIEEPYWTKNNPNATLLNELYWTADEMDAMQCQALALVKWVMNKEKKTQEQAEESLLLRSFIPQENKGPPKESFKHLLQKKGSAALQDS